MTPERRARSRARRNILLDEGHGVGEKGRKRRVGVEDEYWKLILAAVGTVEACELFGIGRMTGYRWRAERGESTAMRVERERSDWYLCPLERQRIATLRRQGLSMRQIAARLDRAPSTISRELDRNCAPHDVGGYDGDLALVVPGSDWSVLGVVGSRPKHDCVSSSKAKLDLEWSPEQIAVCVRAEYPDPPRLPP